MKVLFISGCLSVPNQGVYETARLHHLAFLEVFGAENVDTVSLAVREVPEEENIITLYGSLNKFSKALNLLSGRPLSVSVREEAVLIQMIENAKYDLVWINDSNLGKLIKKIKTKFPEILVIEYHPGTIRSSMEQQRSDLHVNIVDRLNTDMYLRGEKLGAKYADKHVMLNKRDENDFYNEYGRKADAFLPVCYIDRAKIESIRKDEEFRILFVGGYFWPNVLGITWFVNNVMPLVPCATLYIVGRDMEKLRSEQGMEKENIKIIGGTDDLSFWYNSADVVIGPIFHGNGMKTKTTEALMYGKRYLGTKEALLGYENMEQFHCETAEEFAAKINEYIDNGVPRYDPEMRKLFEENHSIETAKRILRQIVCDM